MPDVRKLQDHEKRLIVSQANGLIQKISTDVDYSRNLTKQSFILDVCQKRLIALLISHIHPNDTEFQEEIISFANFMKFMDISDGGKQYCKISESISKLMGMTFCIEVKPNVFEYYHWIADGCRIDFNTRQIHICLSPGLSRFLIDNKKNFTGYELGFIMNLKKKYSCRLYEFLHSVANFGTIKMTVESFSQKITDNKYSKAADQKRFVLEPAIEEINNTSDLTVTYECKTTKRSVRGGREAITGYIFHITEKSYEEKQAIMGTWGIDFEDILILSERERPNFPEPEPEFKDTELPF